MVEILSSVLVTRRKVLVNVDLNYNTTVVLFDTKRCVDYAYQIVGLKINRSLFERQKRILVLYYFYCSILFSFFR